MMRTPELSPFLRSRSEVAEDGKAALLSDTIILSRRSFKTLLEAFLAGASVAIITLCAIPPSTFTAPTAIQSVAPASPGPASTYYVAPTGSDANPGTEARPFKTITYGVRKLIPGATLYVTGGVYEESLYNAIPGGTSWSQPVTVAAYPGHTVTIKPSAGSGTYSVLAFASSTRAYIIIDGFIIDATNVFHHGIKIDYGTNAGPSHHIRITNCEVKNAPHSGIFVAGIPGKSSNYNEFINLDVHDNGADGHDHGIYIQTDHNLVENSRFYRNAGFGVHVYNGHTPIANENIIRNNLIYDNAQAGKVGSGIILTSGSRNLAYNNILWGNQGGIYIDYGASDSQVYHNVAYNNREYGIYAGSASTFAVIKNNIVHQNSVPGIQNSGVGTVSDHNLVGIDPKFVNAAAFDFRLQSGSPAIDTGTTVSAVTSDFDGTPRPQGAAYNIGAFE